jgi:beta-phosphoglucomutase-like phosphatase (HAD superfamily)|eukprot:Transcript_16069.p1 GENE.Transcript_16069~~Transcript_16069.p1  ORF type:complete len:304 (-),score=74.62 Transcript_16069:279-1100(-)
MWWRFTTYLAAGIAGLAVVLATRRRLLHTLLRAAPAASLAPGMLTVGPKALPDAAVKGHLFDVDGTLIDTMPLFYQSWVDVCDGFGLSITEHQFYGFAGLPLPEIVRRLHQAAYGSDPPDGFTESFLKAKKAAHNANEARLGSPPPIACVSRLARQAVAAGQPVCVATSGLRDHVEAHLAHAGLADIFPRELIVTAADVPKGKPAPDIYIEAARRIGVRAEDCRAYEDGESGLISAYLAGCHVIDVTMADEYPSCEGLRAAKKIALAERDWVK